MAWESLIPDYRIDNTRADRKGSVSIEQYRVSENAVYFSGKYVPIAAIRSACIQPSLLCTTGCCGKGIPVFKLRLDHGGEKPLALIVEKRQNAEKLLDRIRNAKPDIVVEEYVEPA